MQEIDAFAKSVGESKAPLTAEDIRAAAEELQRERRCDVCGEPYAQGEVAVHVVVYGGGRLEMHQKCLDELRSEW